MSNQSIKEIDGLRKYRTEIPNIADDDMDVFQYRLYGHYKRVCGAAGGECFESVRTTADKTRMSPTKVIETRQWLAENGWVEIEKTVNSTVHVTITDKWSDNFQRLSVPNMEQRVPNMEQRVPNMEQSNAFSVPNMESKKEHNTKKELNKKRVLSAKALPQPELPQPQKQPTATEPVTEKENPTPDAAAPLPTEQQRKFQLLCNIVGWDYKILTPQQTGQVVQTLGILCKAGYTEEHLAKFHDQVWAKDWRWQQHHSYPSLAQVRAEMGKLKLQQQVAATRTAAAVEQQQTAIPQMLRMQQRKGFYTQ